MHCSYPLCHCYTAIWTLWQSSSKQQREMMIFVVGLKSLFFLVKICFETHMIHTCYCISWNLPASIVWTLSVHRPQLISSIIAQFIFIRPESDHRQCLSVTDSLTHSVMLIDVTRASEDAKLPTQNLLRVSLLLMLMMWIVLATVSCRFGSWGWVIKLNFCSDFEHNNLKLKFRQDS